MVGVKCISCGFNLHFKNVRLDIFFLCLFAWSFLFCDCHLVSLLNFFLLEYLKLLFVEVLYILCILILGICCTYLLSVWLTLWCLLFHTIFTIWYNQIYQSFSFMLLHLKKFLPIPKSKSFLYVLSRSDLFIQLE